MSILPTTNIVYICNVILSMRYRLILFSVLSFITAVGQPAENYFRFINSDFDEQHPVASSDGQTLFFTVANHPQNIGGKKDPGDIWYSTWNGKEWTAPVHGGTLINDRAYNAVAGVSKNGEQIFLHGHYDPSGNMARTQGISIASKNQNGWSRPANISIPYFLNRSGLISGNVSSDGSVFIFSAEGYGTHGVDDLYVSLLVDGKWTEPKNLGPSINTQFQELSPSLSADGKTLYFSTNGLKGRGSFDVFSATRLDDSWTSWSAPVNLGTDINTEGRELYYREGSLLGYAFFTSTINSDGYGDIKMFKAPINIPVDTSIVTKLPSDTLIKIVEIAPDTTVSQNPEVATTPLTAVKTVRVYGRIVNSKTGEGVQGTISFNGPLHQEKTVAAADGFSVPLPANEPYTVSIESNGFISELEKLDIQNYENAELEINFKLQPVEIGTRVNLKNVLFAQTKSEILPESYPELDLVVNFLKSNPNVKIELAGHTDNRGVHSDNIKLSQLRVNKVKEYLVEKGIDSKRISGKGYGGTKPIASNNTEESRKMNRRVEFIIKKF
jgi:OOP family OmpA-OmpF porin